MIEHAAARSEGSLAEPGTIRCIRQIRNPFGLVFRMARLAAACLAAMACKRAPTGAQLARANCVVCHAFPEPALLDKKTWQDGVLPQMAKRVGVTLPGTPWLALPNPYMKVLARPLPDSDWAKILAYYRDSAPDKLPAQSLPAQPTIDPSFFAVHPLAEKLPSSGIITLLAVDSARKRIYVGEAGSNSLRVFDYHRRLLSSVTLGSPPTAAIFDSNRVLVLESGILDPNDRAKGRLVQYDRVGRDSLRFGRVIIDSLLRPVFVQRYDFAKDGHETYVICEFGNNRGRLALYKNDGSRYVRQVLDANPGAIHFEIRDLTGDGAPDIVALLAQADERIVLFVNDGKGNFTGAQRLLARFPPVYGSMYFAMYDFNGDGFPDIVYVNGDNYDYSRVLKPYHGVRILENDGKNNFHERYFFPVYGAARAEVADFEHDGKLDIFVTSNFADFQAHPERGIVFLRNLGGYRFQPYAFSVAAGNQWNLTATADLEGDGSTDVLVASMNLESIENRQQRVGPHSLDAGKDAIFVFRYGGRGTGDGGRDR